MKIHPFLQNFVWAAVVILIPGFAGMESKAEESNELQFIATDKGVEIDAGKMGKFILQPPCLTTDGDKKMTGTWKANGDEGDVDFPDGTKFKYKLKKGEIVCSFRSIPNKGQPKFMFIMGIPLTFGQGGKFKFEEKKFTDFPEKIETEQFIVKGVNSDFTLIDKEGNGLAFELKTNWYGLQDDRVWTGNQYSYQFLVDALAVPGNSFVIKIKSLKPEKPQGRNL